MFQRKRRTINTWAAVVALMFLLLFFVVIGRFVYIAQGKQIDGHKLVEMGKKQWTEVNVIDEKRGTIFSKNGQVLAEDIPAYTLYAVLSPKAPSYVKDKEKTAKKLAPILGLSESKLRSILNQPLYQVEFGTKGKKLSYKQKQAIDKLRLPGLGYLKGSKRYYPGQSEAAYTIGFTQTNPNTDQKTGVFGVEQSLNKYLAEQDGTVRFYTSSGGVPIPDTDKHMTATRPGDNVYLTLDSRIQTIMDEAMTKVEQDYKPEQMIGIVADPKTGQILALSNRPDFNPNKRNIKNFANNAISTPYEPGSVMKTFTVAAAINEGVYKGSQTYKSGSYKVGGVTIHDWNRTGWGTIDFDQAFERSSNVGLSILADKYLGTDKLHDYLDRFGFLQKTGIDLPNESDSNVGWKWKSAQVETSFGQGSAFTAMQIVQAATAIANNGKMMRPYIIDKVVNPKTGKTVAAHHPTVAGRPITKKTAEETRRLMRLVVTGKYGTGRSYDLKGYDVIGKTGTAQIAVKGQYLVGKNNYIFSFLGMAPQKDPKLIVYVAVDRPHLKPTDLGEEPVTDIVNPVMSSSLQYMNVSADKSAKTDQAVPSVTLDQFVGVPMSEAAAALKAKGLDVTAIGDGRVTNQLPYDGENVFKGSKVILVGSGNKKMPDLSGWSLADSLKLAAALSLHPKINGDGYVTQQKPAEGSDVHPGDDLSLTLKAAQ